MSQPSLPAPIRFGTDGIRGPAGSWPLTEEGVRVMGRALAEHVREAGGGRILVGRDTRESGEALAEAVLSSICEVGLEAVDGGIMPTAAVSCAVAGWGGAPGYDAGVVLTASHNPWQDNGLKILGPDGGKFQEQDALSARFAAVVGPLPSGCEPARTDAMGPWRAAMPRLDLSGLTVLLDAAHGAGAPHAPGVLEALGARVIRRGCAPDGRNINAGVGAMHPPDPSELGEAALALCLDGDADRIVLVDAVAGVLDGDDILWLLAAEAEGPVVGTNMSNGGLEAALGGRLVRAQVGDRHVAAQMRRTGAAWGAEPSGHVLFADGLPTGDGLYSALRVLQAVADEAGRPRLPLPVGGWERWPAVLKNHRYAGQRPALEGLPELAAAQAAGMRVVVRYSGTEPKVRVLVEGKGTGAGSAEAWCDRIIAALAAQDSAGAAR